MRVMLKVAIPVEKGNELIKKGTLGKTMQSILGELKPEAAYFGADNGRRTGFIFLNINDVSQMPSIAEPFFLAFNAGVDFTPVMSPEDLGKAMAGVAGAVQKYS